MSTNDEFDYMGEADASSTIGLPKLNFGKCTISSRFIQWSDKTPIEVTAAQFAKLDPKQRSQEAVISIDIQEFNPNLQFTYSRKVQVGGLDWNKIFKPSLFKALHMTALDDKDRRTKQVSEAMRKLNGAYVCVEDVPQSPTKREPESKYNTAKVIMVFASRVECFEHWKSTYNKAGANGASEVESVGPVFANGIPDGYDAQSWAGQKEAFATAYQEYVKTLKGTVPQKRVAALAYVAENEAGSTAEQLAELLGV